MPERLNHQKELCPSFSSYHRARLVFTRGCIPGWATEDSIGWDDNLRKAFPVCPSVLVGIPIIIKLYCRHEQFLQERLPDG